MCFYPPNVNDEITRFEIYNGNTNDGVLMVGMAYDLDLCTVYAELQSLGSPHSLQVNNFYFLTAAAAHLDTYCP